MICGVHAVFEVLAAGRQPVERLHILRDAHLPRLKQILDLARERGVPIRKEERSVLDKIAGGVVHQGIVAIVGEASYAPLEKAFDAKVPCLVVLDGIEDTSHRLVSYKIDPVPPNMIILAEAVASCAAALKNAFDALEKGFA